MATRIRIFLYKVLQTGMFGSFVGNVQLCVMLRYCEFVGVVNA